MHARSSARQRPYNRRQVRVAWEGLSSIGGLPCLRFGLGLFAEGRGAPVAAVSQVVAGLVRGTGKQPSMLQMA